MRVISLLALALLLVACSFAQTVRLTSGPTVVYPVEEAWADADWTLLERVMPWGEAHNIMIPSSWSPTALRDSDLVKVQIEQGADKTIITLERVHR